MTPRALFHPARLARRPVLSTQSDERLVDLVRAGSDPAFEAIVERYRRALMRYVSRLLPPERAEDVVQQSFVKAYEAMHRDAAELNLKPWLYRIAHNGALNALRDRALGHAELDERIDGVERPDQAFERATELRELVVAVQALPERQRDAILLRELEGRSYEEIGTALGVTDGAVRQLLNRARNSLRAAAAAVTPGPIVARVAGADSAEPVAARMAELVGVGGGALAMKVCATALVTGAVVGGAAVVPEVGREQRQASASERPASRTMLPDLPVHTAVKSGRSPFDAVVGGERRAVERRSGERGDRRERAESGSGGGDYDDDRSGPGSGDDDDRSGPGGGGDHDRSGPGGGDDRSGSGGGDEPDNSGPGGGGDSSGPGSGEPQLAEDTSGTGGGDEPDGIELDSSGPGGGGSSGSGSDDPDPLETDNSGSGSGSG